MARLIIVGMFLFFVAYVISKFIVYLSEKAFFADSSNDYDYNDKNTSVWHTFKDCPHFTGEVRSFVFLGKNKQIYTGQCQNREQWDEIVKNGTALHYWAYGDDIMPKK